MAAPFFGDEGELLSVATSVMERGMYNNVFIITSKQQDTSEFWRSLIDVVPADMCTIRTARRIEMRHGAQCFLVVGEQPVMGLEDEAYRDTGLIVVVTHPDATTMMKGRVEDKTKFIPKSCMYRFYDGSAKEKTTYSYGERFHHIL